ncbi:uncharacterized protein LOC124899503 [Capsicum annuum]|uniref:uncharacterized protein LOC124899503 n=1 Tax=Capsicum annuum TaxID=4072 RepID=UPI001FB156B1|nr:uncharacterized protein LOC124899503 [Capsicum annuum]
MTVTTRRGNVLVDPPVGKPVVDVMENKVEKIEIDHLVESGKLDQVIGYTPSHHQQVDKLEKSNGKKTKVVVTSLPKAPPLFPCRSKKKADNVMFEELKKMPGYSKFMKGLVTNKQIVCFELVSNLHHCGAISTRSLLQKKEDPGEFIIPCTIRPLDFTKALCDLEASINFMPLAMYKELGLWDPTPINMRLVIKDRYVKRPLGIPYDV